MVPLQDIREGLGSLETIAGLLRLPSHTGNIVSNIVITGCGVSWVLGLLGGSLGKLYNV